MEPPLAEVTLMAAVLVVSAILHTTTGFGYALLSAPVLAALSSPREAVSTILATAVVVDVLVLIGHGGRPAPRARDVLLLSAWSLPGLALGAALLRVLPVPVLQLLAAAAVFFAVWLRLRRTRPREDPGVTRAQPWPHAAAAGLASGTLHTSTTLSGPPLVLYLMRRPRPPRVTRDTLVSISLLRLPVSVALLLLAGAWVAPPALPALWLAVALGYLVGRWLFGHMDVARYERAVLLVLVVAALTAVTNALT